VPVGIARDDGLEVEPIEHVAVDGEPGHVALPSFNLARVTIVTDPSGLVLSVR